jgi:hypothetical protein
VDLVKAPAWRADWINAWLAAIGVTVICEEARLAWTSDPIPSPVFHVPIGFNLSAELADRMPAPSIVQDCSVRHITGQNPTESQYILGASEARATGDWLWSALFTDLGPIRKPRGREGAFDKSLFYPGMPGTAPISKRLSDIAKLTWANDADITASMGGYLPRQQGNGLGFDQKRLLSPADPSGGVYIDPVAECLAFFALTLFAVRGDCSNVMTRGEQRGRPFRWRTWAPPLDLAGIDALLALPPDPSTVTFELVTYRKKSTNEATAAYFSRVVP